MILPPFLFVERNPWGIQQGWVPFPYAAHPRTLRWRLD